MATRQHCQEGVPENLRQQLAIAVRNIQWSYAIFWSLSSGQPEVLQWGDGYYNGDIKTRKTVQAVEFDANLLGLQRSEQLRELYESLSANETIVQGRRPSAALSPEDLTDTEWYYLVCMSFVFNIGQGLPGRTLANGQPTWLCNAHYADSKVFSRSLLAKSASIQTVACFPFLGGVVELGITDLVLEDPNLIQHIKTSFLETPCPIVTKIPSYILGTSGDGEEFVCVELDHGILDTNLDPVVECEELKNFSPDNSSNGFLSNQQADESFIAEGLNGCASQGKRGLFMEDEISNCIHSSTNSGDCVSRTFVHPEKDISVSKGEKANGRPLPDLQQCSRTKLNSLDVLNDDIHYQSVLSTLFKSTHQLILGAYFKNCNKESSFISWKKRSLAFQKAQSGTPQRMLKKVLFEVAQMHRGFLVESAVDNSGGDGPCRSEADEIDATHPLSERKKGEKINERLSVLGSLVPSAAKADKICILDNTIEYLKELERRVVELESCKDMSELKTRTGREPQDAAERTSDDPGNKKMGNGKKLLINKRKACDIDEADAGINSVPLKDGSTDSVAVNVIEKDVLIEIRCPWRECLLLEIVDAISHLHLDSHLVQSSNTDGILSLSIRSKLKVSKAASPGMIKQALHRVVWKC